MPAVVDGDTDRALDLMIDLDRRWRAGDDQQVWTQAERELDGLRVAFGRLVAAGRAIDAQRLAACAFGPMTMHFDSHTASDWAHAALALSNDAVGPWTASACAVAAWGDMAQGRLGSAAELLQRGLAALDDGAVDDGLLVAAALHLTVFGGDAVLHTDRLDTLVGEALAVDDPHRHIWVCSYTGRADDALTAATDLGSQVLTALALSATAIAAPEDIDLAERWWMASRAAHSFLLRNNAARHLAALRVRGDSTLGGMHLLEDTAADWLHRHDTRVWDALWSMAVGFHILGDHSAAAALRTAVGARPVGTVSTAERKALDHYRSTGPSLGPAGAVALASDHLAALDHDADASIGSAGSLTTRQRQVAELIAKGLRNKEIAAALGVSPLTAETHVRNILARTGAPSRAAVAALVAERLLS